MAQKKYLNTYRLAVYLMTLFTSTNHKPALPFVFFKNFNSLESLSQLKYFQNVDKLFNLPTSSLNKH